MARLTQKSLKEVRMNYFIMFEYPLTIICDRSPIYGLGRRCQNVCRNALSRYDQLVAYDIHVKQFIGCNSRRRRMQRNCSSSRHSQAGKPFGARMVLGATVVTFCFVVPFRASLGIVCTDCRAVIGA